MKLFIRRLLLFSSVPLVLLLAAELFLRQMPTSYKIKNQQLNADAAAIELLILGNSHATYGLNPNLFSLNAFNMASVNQSLYFDKRITLSHLAQMKSLKYVLISIDFHSLYFSDAGFHDVPAYYAYKINYKDSLPPGTTCSYLHGYTLPVALTLIGRAFDKKYAIVRSLDVDYDVDLTHPYTKGYVGKIAGPYLAEADNRERAAWFNSLVHSSTERAAILSDLADFIRRLKQRNITPVLISLPCYIPFQQLLDDKVKAQNNLDIQCLCRQYHLPYWDYSTAVTDPGLFYNCDHLNEKGAAFISADVNRRLLALEAGGKPSEIGYTAATSGANKKGRTR